MSNNGSVEKNSNGHISNGLGKKVHFSSEREVAWNPIRDFFWFCSGADTDILKQCPKSEHVKFTGIGGTVFFTGLLAAISGGYALYTIFDSYVAAILFGIVWGLVIFNLDRYIVSTIKKRGDWKSELIQVTPRLLLALLIAIVISRPLELRIFKGEIDAQVLQDQNKMEAACIKEVEKQFVEMEELKTERTKAQDWLASKEKERNVLYEAYVAEAEGTAGSGVKGRGPVFEEKKMQYDKIEEELAKFRKRTDEQIASLDKRIFKYIDKRDKASEECEAKIAGYNGLIARLEALSKLPQMPSLFIILLFICIESAPIFTKLLSGKGAYDELSRAIDHQYELQKIETVNQANQQLNHSITLKTGLDKQKIEQELANKRRAMDIVSNAHLDVVQEMVDIWLEKEKEKMREKERNRV